jgi:transcriptional regulator with XRE-family HTH domain
MNISTYLAEAKMTEAELARLVGCDRSTINRLRNGTRRESDEVIRRIVAVTGGRVTADEIVGSILAPAVPEPRVKTRHAEKVCDA